MDTHIRLQRLRAAAPWIGLALLAMMATVAVGDGNLLADGASELHIDPIHFLRQITYAWTPSLFLGFHTGAMHLYANVATVVYASLFAAHVPSSVAQRIVDFSYFYAIVAGMYWALGAISPGLRPFARFCGAAACLFNPYVAFNSLGSTPFLLLYAEIPWLTGVTASVARRTMSPFAGAIAVALVTLVGSGNNMPLTFLAAIVATLYAAIALVATDERRALFVRFVIFGAASFVLGTLVNLYWLAPALDWYRTAWIGGVLDETPALHNGDSSFANVFRGLGQWSIFHGDEAGPWYRWAASYRSGVFASSLWAIVAVALWAPMFKATRTVGTVFFLAVIVLSMPLAVGYYHGALGDAFTTPIYDFLYRQVPGFQIFRAAYKWVSPVTFAVAGLFAISVDAFGSWLLRRSWPSLAIRRRLASAVCGVALVVVVASYVPVVVSKANDPLVALPSWVRDESKLVPADTGYRLALFPTQYADRFAWGSPMYEMENGLIDRGTIHGYLGSAANQGSNQWIMRAFHASRDDDPAAREIFAMLSANELLQRDDFDNRLTPDFAFPSDPKTNTTSTAHDIVSRVLGGRPVARAGANRVYDLADALPLVYAVDRPTLASYPASSDSGDLAHMARGVATVSTDGVGLDGLTTLVDSGVRPSSDPADIAALAVTAASDDALTIDAQVPESAFDVRKAGWYVPFVANTEFFPQPERSFGAIDIDGKLLAPRFGNDTGWRPFRPISLAAGRHHLDVERVSWSQSVRVKLVERGALDRLTGDVATLVRDAGSSRIERDVDGATAVVRVPRAATYAVTATGVVSRGSFATSEPVGSRRVGLSSLATSRQSSLAVIPVDGVDDSEPTMMPQSWYARSETYDWDRANPSRWQLLTRDARFYVVAPGGGTTAAVLRARLSAMGPSVPIAARRIDVVVNGRRASTVVVAGGRPDETTQNARTFRFAAPLASIAIPISLHEGVNDIRLIADGGAGIRMDSESASYVAALAPDVDIRIRSRSGRSVASTGPLDRRPYRAYRLDLPSRALDGAPHLTGRIVADPASPPIAARLALRFAGRADAFYTVPLPTNGAPFDVELPERLPNVATEAGTYLEDAFVLTSPGSPPIRPRVDYPLREPRLDGIAFRRAVLSPRLLGGLSLARARVLTDGLVGSATRSASKVSIAFDRSVAALPTTVEFTIAAGRPVRDARLVVPLAVDWLECAPSLEVRDRATWRLVGERTDLRAIRRRRSDGTNAVTFEVPFGVDIAPDDVRSGRVSLEANGVAIPVESIQTPPSPTQPSVHLEFPAGRLTTITITSKVPVGSLATVVMPSDWITQADGRIFLSVPATRIVAPGHEATTARVRIAFAPDFRLDIRRSIDVFAPRWMSTTRGETNDRDDVSIDGRRLVRGRIALAAGPHLVTSIDPARTIAHLSVEDVRTTVGRRVSVGAVRRSPVDLRVTVPPHARPLVVVFGESYHPEWRARIDGRPLRHVVVDGFSNGWIAPASLTSQAIEIDFTAQALFDRTLAISSLTLVVLLGVRLAAIRRRRAGFAVPRTGRSRIAGRRASA